MKPAAADIERRWASPAVGICHLHQTNGGSDVIARKSAAFEVRPDQVVLTYPLAVCGTRQMVGVRSNSILGVAAAECRALAASSK